MQQTHRVKDCQKDGGLGNLEKKTFIANLTERKQGQFQYVGERESLTTTPTTCCQ